MTLPVVPPMKPMLAKAVTAIPPDAIYEPKWDGFRSICFRDGDDVVFGSRNERPLTRYFPELVEAARRELPDNCVLDGEIVVATKAGLDFEALQQRIHPADSRVQLLAAKTRASFIGFDLLAVVAVNLEVERRGDLAQPLYEVVGEGVVFIDEKDHGAPGGVDPGRRQSAWPPRRAD